MVQGFAGFFGSAETGAAPVATRGGPRCRAAEKGRHLARRRGGGTTARAQCDWTFNPQSRLQLAYAHSSLPSQLLIEASQRHATEKPSETEAMVEIALALTDEAWKLTFKTLKHVHVCDEDEALRALLESWIKVVKRYCDAHERDNCWWYNERASLSTLAGAAWAIKGASHWRNSARQSEHRHLRRAWKAEDYATEDAIYISDALPQRASIPMLLKPSSAASLLQMEGIRSFISTAPWTAHGKTPATS